MAQKAKVEWQVPRAFRPFLDPARYKAAYGGRGGAKSHFFASHLIVKAHAKPLRAACIREVQNSIRESVRQLLIDKIRQFGWSHHFNVKEREIVSRWGEPIIFKGMQSYNAANVKSLEGVDICWTEEAQSLSARSLEMLRPTIRKPGSELWFSWNPEFETDAVDAFFRGGQPPPDAVIREVNWRDNPWFPDVLREEYEHDTASDPERAEHIWEGGYNVVSEAAYYARQIFALEKAGRVGAHAYDDSVPVDTSWDIGVDDNTSIWFMQNHGTHVTVIDFWEISGAGAEEIVASAMPEMNPDVSARYAAMADLGRERSFEYGRHYLPHDVGVREWGAGARTRIETLMGLGLRNIHRGVATSPDDRVNAVRRLLPQMYFADTPRVRAGLNHLRRYSRRRNEQLGVYVGPLKDGHDHASDAFGEYAINVAVTPLRAPEPKRPALKFGQTRLPGPPVPQAKRRIRL